MAPRPAAFAAPCLLPPSHGVRVTSRCASYAAPRRARRARRVRAPRAPPRMDGGAAAAPDLSALLQRRDTRRYVFVTAKGGCGKTTTAAATALRMADDGMPTLVISVDPAHSLGDALKVDLSDGRVKRLEPELPLWAVECDTAEAVREFQALINGLRDGKEEGVAGWGDVAGMLDTVPPGADELIALISILNVVESESEGVDFKRIIVDCAPTGHTLRLLSFPDFLDNLLTKALSLRSKLNAASGVVNNVAKMFIKDKSVDVDAVLDNAAVRVERYRARMTELSDMLRDPGRAEFLVVSIPTVMAVSETARLIDRLWEDGIWVRHAVANMILQPGDAAMEEAYLQRMRKGQARQLAFATEQIADEYGLELTPLFLFDTELRGVYALRALAAMAFDDRRKASYGRLFVPADEGAVVAPGGAGAQFVFAAGKGGVGKTSVSCTMGVSLADQGFKTLVISTDPAHSLGDSLDMSFEGGRPTPVDGTNGNLYGMEVDTGKAVLEFKELVKEFSSESSTGVGSDIARTLGLGEFADILDNAPPGIDELVALTQVLALVNDGDFERVVVDCAPTGHCLRLLRFPEFLDGFLGKLLRLKLRLDATIGSLRNVLGRKSRSTADAVDAASQKVEQFRVSMTMLKELLVDPGRTQFVLVAIPTALAMAESERLVRALQADGVAVRNMVVNQVIADDSAAAFVERSARGQGACLQTLDDVCRDKDIMVTRLPYFDTEVRGLPALRALAMLAFASEPARVP